MKKYNKKQLIAEIITFVLAFGWLTALNNWFNRLIEKGSGHLHRHLSGA